MIIFVIKIYRNFQKSLNRSLWDNLEERAKSLEIQLHNSRLDRDQVIMSETFPTDIDQIRNALVCDRSFLSNPNGTDNDG